MADWKTDTPALDGRGTGAMLRRLEGTASCFLRDQLEMTLEALGAQLEAWSARAQTDARRQRLDEAVRVLDRAGAALIERFQLQLLAPLDDEAPRQPADEGDVLSTNALSLVEDDVLDRRLAIAGLSQRINRECDTELTHLRHRYQAVAPEGAVRVFEPEQIARAWALALEPVTLPSDVRLTVFKCFEAQISCEIGRLFASLNQLLADGGVLPDLILPGTGARDADSRAHRARPARAEEVIELPEEDEINACAAADRLAWFTSLRPAELHRELAGLPGLRARRALSRLHSGDPALLAPVLAGIVASAQIRLASLLADHALDSVPRRIDYGELIVRGAEARGCERARVAEGDEDILNFVQMLFDVLLEDAQLPVPIRALLARLQFPMLRIALEDAAFVTSAEHPARVFLHRLCRTGISWVRAEERHQDRIFRVLERSVDEIAAGFVGDLAIFETATARIVRALDAERAVVRRTGERALAREQAQLAAAQALRVVDRLVHHRSARVALPELKSFLEVEWQRVLFHTYQEEGPGSDEWKLCVRVLLGVTGAQATDEAELHDALVKGLRRIGRDETTAVQLATRARAWMLDDEAATPDAGAAARALDVQAQTQDNIERLPDRELLDRALALEVDTWLELRTGNDLPVRVRLASVTAPPERCIFLDRRGNHARTLSRLEIAAGMQAGRIFIVEKLDRFTAALEGVFEALGGHAARDSDRASFHEGRPEGLDPEADLAVD